MRERGERDRVRGIEIERERGGEGERKREGKVDEIGGR